MTEEKTDHSMSLEQSQNMQSLSVDEIAAKLGVNRRTVYRLVEREGWQKSESLRGRVFYTVPLSFIDRYVTETQKDHSYVSDMSVDNVTQSQRLPATDSLPVSDSLIALIVADRDSRIQKLEEKIQEKEQIIEDLRTSLTNVEKKLARLEGEAKGKDELLSEKDRTIEAKNQTINAANAAVMLMEQQRSQALSVKTSDGSESDSPENRRNWVQRLLSREKK